MIGPFELDDPLALDLEAPTVLRWRCRCGNVDLKTFLGHDGPHGRVLLSLGAKCEVCGASVGDFDSAARRDLDRLLAALREDEKVAAFLTSAMRHYGSLDEAVMLLAETLPLIASGHAAWPD